MLGGWSQPGQSLAAVVIRPRRVKPALDALPRFGPRHYARAMTEPPRRTLASWLLGAVTCLVLAVAVIFAVRGSLQSPGVRPPPRMIAEEDAAQEDGITRAERLAAVDSSEKTTWVDDIPGIELILLPSARREVFIRFANAQSCTCGCGFTLAACRRFDSACEVSLPRLERLRDSVAAGLATRVDGLRERPIARR